MGVSQNCEPILFDLTPISQTFDLCQSFRQCCSPVQTDPTFVWQILSTGMFGKVETVYMGL